MPTACSPPEGRTTPVRASSEYLRARWPPPVERVAEYCPAQTNSCNRSVEQNVRDSEKSRPLFEKIWATTCLEIRASAVIMTACCQAIDLVKPPHPNR